jgi:hypothetical protein
MCTFPTLITIKDYLLRQLLSKDYNSDTYRDFTEDERKTIHISGEQIYHSKTMQINYTTYNMKHDGDIINPTTYPDIMVKSPETGQGAQPYWYACIISIFHAYVLSSHSGVGQKMLCPTKIDFLWVCWFGMEWKPYHHGFHHACLPKIGFIKSLDYYAFTFLNLAQVIRGVHLIPAFSEKRTSDLLPVTSSMACILNPNEQDDWLNFYVNM